jgi:hypothetical protein
MTNVCATAPRLGYIEGQNLLIERYWADGRHDRYAEVARS